MSNTISWIGHGSHTHITGRKCIGHNKVSSFNSHYSSPQQLLISTVLDLDD